MYRAIGSLRAGKSYRVAAPLGLNGESADVPENIVVAWWSLRFPRYTTATGTPRQPFSVWPILLCIAYVDVCSGVHVHPGK